MRIVITKNGKILISEINPEIKYKSISTIHNHFTPAKILNKTKLNNSKNNSFHNTSNNLTIQHKNQNVDIDDVLLSFQTKDKKLSSSSQCKILDISPNKHLNLPQSIAERYFTDQTPIERETKNFLPDVFLSINKSIEKDANEKGFNYIYNNISALKTIPNKEDSSSFQMNSDQNEVAGYSTSFNLPKILPAYPLKYIINQNSMNNIKKEVKLKEYQLKRGKKLTEDNFRSQVLPDPRRTMELSLKNEIKTENTNLITYLNKSKDIKGPFVERLGNYSTEHIKKLNKISQKTIFLKGQEKVIKDMIQTKIKGKFRHSSEEYKEGLESLKAKLHRYDGIVKAEEQKKIDKRERYLNQYREAEKYWVKSKALRFYKKSDPPKNSATGLVIEK